VRQSQNRDRASPLSSPLWYSAERKTTFMVAFVLLGFFRRLRKGR
jgi:hypothetical protein